MGHRAKEVDHSPAVDIIYGKIQSELLSIPGHALYYEERILAQQKQCEGVGVHKGPRVDYDRMRGWDFVTLSHLPSPETVGVLGRFLLDDRDYPEQAGVVYANSDHAMNSLKKIGIREMPTKQQVKLTPDEWKQIQADPARRDLYPHPWNEQWEEMRGWRLWWDDVKNGRKTFSFKGQSVEYRFKPDGTWETLAMVNPPDDGPKLAGKVVPPVGGKAEPVAGEVPRGWVWLVFPVILAAGLAIWWGARRFAKNS